MELVICILVAIGAIGVADVLLFHGRIGVLFAGVFRGLAGKLRGLFPVCLGIAFALGISVARADDVNVITPECTAWNVMNCGTYLDLTVSPGTGFAVFYVSQDGGTWQVMSCLARQTTPYVYRLYVDWIWRQHDHRFGSVTQNDCNWHLTTPALLRYAAAFDPTLHFLAPPASDTPTPGYAWVFRETSGLRDYLRFEKTWNGTQFVTLPKWSSDGSIAQLFTVRAAENLAAMAAYANSAGYYHGTSYGDNFTAYAASGVNAPNCMIRDGLSSAWSSYFDKTIDARLWSSGMVGFTDGSPPTVNGGIFQLMYVHCGDNADGDSRPLVALMKSVANTPVFQRNFGVKRNEISLYMCNGGSPSVCMQ